ncbi:MAG: FeoA family protein [Bifidobacteriaceae bacterium]|nr:FeoA family protein [Bifidobacteriaceae bacterium]
MTKDTRNNHARGTGANGTGASSAGANGAGASSADANSAGGNSAASVRAGTDIAHDALTLRDAKTGEQYVMAGTTLDDRHAFRLEEMGLRQGTALQVIQRTNFGGRVVASGTQRIAIDGGTARRILIEPASQMAAPYAHERGNDQSNDQRGEA